jgi:hypothetical protein
MTFVMRCLALTGQARHPSSGTPAGQYLKSYNPEAHEGRGFAEWTRELDEALKFETPGDAWMLWRFVPNVRPIRLDGKLNMPLAAFTIEIIREDAARAAR